MDIYEIGVKLGLTNGVSDGLGLIAQEFVNVRLGVRKAEEQLRSFRWALGQAVVVGAGVAIAKGVSDIASATGQFVNQQSLMLAAGRKQRDIAGMTAAVWRDAAKAIPVTSASAQAAEWRPLGNSGSAWIPSAHSRRLSFQPNATLPRAVLRAVDFDGSFQSIPTEGPTTMAAGRTDSAGGRRDHSRQSPYQTPPRSDVREQRTEGEVRAWPHSSKLHRIFVALLDITGHANIPCQQNPLKNALIRPYDMPFSAIARYDLHGMWSVMRTLDAIAVTAARLPGLEKASDETGRAPRGDRAVSKDWRAHHINFMTPWLGPEIPGGRSPIPRTNREVSESTTSLDVNRRIAERFDPLADRLRGLYSGCLHEGTYLASKVFKSASPSFETARRSFIQAESAARPVGSMSRGGSRANLLTPGRAVPEIQWPLAKTSNGFLGELTAARPRGIEAGAASRGARVAGYPKVAQMPLRGPTVPAATFSRGEGEPTNFRALSLQHGSSEIGEVRAAGLAKRIAVPRSVGSPKDVPPSPEVISNEGYPHQGGKIPRMLGLPEHLPPVIVNAPVSVTVRMPESSSADVGTLATAALLEGLTPADIRALATLIATHASEELALAVTRAIRNVHRDARRQSMIDWSDASVRLGGAEFPGFDAA